MVSAASRKVFRVKHSRKFKNLKFLFFPQISKEKFNFFIETFILVFSKCFNGLKHENHLILNFLFAWKVSMENCWEIELRHESKSLWSVFLKWRNWVLSLKADLGKWHCRVWKWKNRLKMKQQFESFCCFKYIFH